MIRTVIETFKISGISLSSMILGAAVDPGTLGDDTHITIGTAVSITAVIVGAAWYIGRKVQQWEDQLDALGKKLDERPCIKKDDCPVMDDGK